MKYCPSCAVALRGDKRVCPLCGSPLQNEQPVISVDAQPVQKQAYERATEKVRRQPWIIGLVTFGVLIIPAAITLIVDLLINRAATWSLIVIGALGLLLLFISMPALVFYLDHNNRSSDDMNPTRRRAVRKRKFWLLMILNAIATWGYLLYLDTVDGDGVLNWALDYGSLVTLSTLAVIMLFFYTLQPPGAVRRGSLLFLWLSLYIWALDALTSWLLLDGEFFGWSLIVGASLIPIGIVYWIIEFLVRSSDRAKRKLHI